MKHKKSILIFLTLLILLCGMLIGWKFVATKHSSSDRNSSTQSKIKKIYNVKNQRKIAASLEREKENPDYTAYSTRNL